MHLFLSPHFDDAVYSCGGTIYQLAQSGDTVRVYTVMGALPPDVLPESPIVQDLHQRWKAGENPVVMRRVEDESAIHGLDAEAAYNSVIGDCVYRLGRESTALYDSEESLFGRVHRDDPALRLLSSKIPDAENLWRRIEFDDATGNMRFVVDADEPVTLYAPLAIGNHVDHQIVRDWALALQGTYPYLNLKFYEDFPYNRDSEAIPPVLQSFEIALKPDTVHLTNDAVQAKIRAVAAYRSQISTFWPNEAELAADVEALLRKRGGGTPAEIFYDR